MRLAVFGASGRTGRLILQQGQNVGYEMTAVTRRPHSIAAGVPVQVVSADITDPVAVKKAVDGCEAVVCAVSTPYSRGPIRVFSQGVFNIVAAMKRQSIQRLVVVSSAMVDPNWRPSGARFFNNVIDPLILRKLGRTLYEDMERMESELVASGLDWTIIRPSGLINTKTVTNYRIAESSADGQYTGRPDLAAMVLEQVRDERFIGKAVGIVTTDIRPSPIQLMALWGEALRREAN